MMNESNNIPINDDLNSVPSNKEGGESSEIVSTTPDQQVSELYDNIALEQDLDETVVTHNNSDDTERYWNESSNAYCIAHERGELFESNDEIKPVKGSKEYECFAATRIGGRKENQDTAAFRLTERGLLLVVCDGMGGGPSGKRASFLAAHVISKYIGQCNSDIPDTQLMEEALQVAHNVLKLDMSRYPQNLGMGTTAAALLINKEHAVLAHIGDSRIYQLRDARRVFRTTDHSLVARKMQLEGWTDEEARTSDESNIITQAIGHRDIEPDIEVRPYVKGDRFLICSDGIWGHFPQKQLLKIICGSYNIGGALSNLMVTTDNIGIEEGNQHDNFTAILVQTNISSKLKDPMTNLSRLCICVLGILLSVSVAINIVQCKRLSSEHEQAIQQTEEKTVPVNMPETNVSDIASTQNLPAEKPVVIKNDSIYITKEGDTTGKIAKIFNISIEKIKQANPDLDLDKISIGQPIVIPLNNNKK